jgi:hypothetical protein
MIEAASAQLGELIDSLALVARIEGGRYEPAVQTTDTLRLVRAARDRVGPEHVEVAGAGGAVVVDPGPTERALADLADCVRRHGGVDPVRVEAGAAQVAFSPVPGAAAPVVLAEDLRDLGAAAAHVLFHALGGSVDLRQETLVVSLPPA